MNENLLTVQEAANILSVSTKTLRRWDKAGKFVPQRTKGNQRRYLKEDIEGLQRSKPKYLSLPPAIQDYTGSLSKQPLTVEEKTYAPQKNFWFSRAQVGLVVGGLFLFVLLLGANLTKSLTGKFLPDFGFRVATRERQLASFDRQDAKEAVLGEATLKNDLLLNVNIPSAFKEDLLVSGLATFSAELTAPNVLYGVTAGSGISVGSGQTPIASNSGVLSLQSKTGELTLSAGTGISLDGLKITNSDLGSSQKIFKTIKVGSDSFSSGSSTDTLELAAGTGISLSANTTDKKVTITGSSSSGWTDDGTVVRLTTSTDSVGIGTTSPSTTFHLVGTSTFTSTSSFNGGVTLGDATSDTLTLYSRVTVGNDTTGNALEPTTGSKFDLGSSTRTWRTLYVDTLSAGDTSLNGSNSDDFRINADNATADAENSTLSFERGTPATNAALKWNATGTPSKLFSLNAPLFINPDSGISYSGTSALIVNQIQSQDIFTASASGTTRFRISNAGHLLPGADNSYDLGSSSLGWRNIYLAGEIFSGSSGTSGHWQRASGALSPTNITDDLLLGATSTASARFAVLNIAGGTPTASVSAGTGGAAYLSASGTLATTALQTLTLGSSTTTGNVILNPSGNIGIGTASPASGNKLHVEGQCVTGDTLLKRRRRGRHSRESGNPWIPDQVGDDNEWEWEDVRIDQIQVGDEILTLDEKTEEFVPQVVEKLMDMGRQEVFELTAGSGERIETTANHPYLVRGEADDEWVKVSELKKGMEIATLGLTNKFIERPIYLFVDETGMGNDSNQPYFGIGGLAIKDTVRLNIEFHNIFEKLLSAYRGKEDRVEFKFSKITKDNKEFYHRVLDILFAAPDWEFNAIAIKKGGKGWTPYSYWKRYIGNTIELANLFPGEKLNIVSDYLSKPNVSVKELTDVLYKDNIENILQLESQGSLILQASDLLLGALAFKLRESEQNKLKKTFDSKEAKREIAQRVWDKIERRVKEEQPNKKDGYKVTLYRLNADVAPSLRRNRLTIAKGNSFVKWEKIIAITPKGRKQTYDIQVRGTHNFVGNNIVAHNTYINGNLGIGDTSPDVLLDILSATTGSDIIITNTNATDTDVRLGLALVDGTNNFTLGVDDSDNDTFKIGTSALETSTTLTIDSRTTTSGVSAITLAGIAPTIASAATAEYTTLTVTPPSITLTGTTQVTSQMDSILINAPTITDTSAVTVDRAATLTVNGAPSAGGSVTITNPAALSILNGTLDQRISANAALRIVGSIQDNGQGGTATLLDGPNNVAVTGNYAYVSSGEGFSVFDISASATPVQKGTLSIAGASAGIGLSATGKYAYLGLPGATGLGLKIVDISNPSSPTSVGDIATNGRINPSVSGNYVFSGNGNDSTVYAYDISDPTNPVQVGTIGQDSTSGPHFISGRYLYNRTTNCCFDGLTIIDVSNPASMSQVGSLNDNSAGGAATGLDDIADIYVVGRYAYVVSTGDDALSIVDVTNPASPSEVGVIRDNIQSGTATGLDGANGVYVSGKYAYVVSDVDDALSIIDVSTPASPVEVAVLTSTSLDAASDVFVYGKYAYVTAGGTSDRLVIIDISGIDVPSANIGDLYATSVEVGESMSIGNKLSVGAGLNVGTGGIFAAGHTGLYSNSGRPALVVTQDGTGDILNLFDGSTEIFTVLDGGNIGIGDTSPDVLLDILSATTGSDIIITNTNATDTDVTVGFALSEGTNTFTMGVDDSDSDKFKISTTALGTSDRFVIDSGGNIGIGGQATPLTALDVTGSASLSANLNLRGAGTAHTFNILGNGTLNFQRSPGGDAGVTTVLYLGSNSNVGLGTTSPLELLDVRGTATVSGNLVLAGAARTIQTTEANTLTIGGTTTGNIVLALADTVDRALRIEDVNGSAYFTVDTRVVSGVSAHTLATDAPTIASGATAEFTTLTVTPPSTKISGTTQITSQMDSILFNAPTFQPSATDTFTLDGASTVTIAGAPVKSDTFTLSNTYGLKINAGAVGTAVNSYGLYVDAPTGATNNYAAVFATGNVGIGNTSPALRLDVRDSQAASAAAQVFNTGTGTDADGLIVKLGNSSTTVVSSTNHFISFETSGIGIVGSVQGSGGTGVSYVTSGIADFAEYLKKDENQTIEYGEVLCIDEKGLVLPCDKYNSKIIGIASERPGFLGGENLGNKSIAVGLVGQVSAKVSTINGPIKPGDFLTSSSISGVAVKATKRGQIVGKALEAFSSDGIGRIPTSVNVGWYDPSISITATGDLNLLENLTVSQPTVELSVVDGKLVVKGNNKENVFTVDGLGNAYFKGVVTADKIKANTIEGLEIFTDKISGLSSAYDFLRGEIAGIATSSALIASSAELAQSGLQIKNLENLATQVKDLSSRVDLLTSSASTSALFSQSFSIDFKDAETLNIKDATVSGTLVALGRTTLSDLGVTGNINAGLLSISGLEGEIYTLSGDLKLQSLGLGGVDILAGKVTIDTKGNMVVAGTITASKVNIDIKDKEAASIGTGVIAASQTSVAISSSWATENSKIFVTATTPTGKQSLFVSKKTAGLGFTVGIEEPYNKDITFDWWVVN